MPADPKIYYCYVLLDPRKPGPFVFGRFTFDYEPFYVGKGHGQRCYSHVKAARKPTVKKSAKVSKIKRLLSLGLRPRVVKVRSKLSESSAFKLECRLISLIGRRDLNQGPLTNLTFGGDGASGYEFTLQDRQRLSSGVKGTWDAYSHSERKARAKNIAQGAKRARASRSCEENARITQRRVASYCKWWDSLSSEERAAHGAKVTASASEKDAFEQLVRSEKSSARQIKTWQAMSPESKALRSARHSASMAARTPEQKAATAEKKRRTRQANQLAELSRREKISKTLKAKSPEERKAAKDKEQATKRRNRHIQKCAGLRQARVTNPIFL